MFISSVQSRGARCGCQLNEASMTAPIILALGALILSRYQRLRSAGDVEGEIASDARSVARCDTHGMGHGHAPEPRRPPGESSSGGVAWRQYVKSGVLLLVAAVSLYVLLPTLVSVFASWRSLSHLEWYFAILVLACEAASYVCLWELDRIA